MLNLSFSSYYFYGYYIVEYIFMSFNSFDHILFDGNF